MSAKIPYFAALALALSAVLVAAESGKPGSRVDIIFVQPEKFTDCKDEYRDTGRGQKYILPEIRSTIEKIASRYLAAGQHLEIRITDIDLAGGFEPWHNLGNDDIRYMRDIYPPRMELQFRLTGPDGKVISENRRKLQDSAFMLTGGFPASDSLRYEREMLRDWMAREFRRSP